MKKILITLFFSALALLFIWLLVKRPELSSQNETRRSPKTIVPADTSEREGFSPGIAESAAFDESRIQPLVLLENNEIFLQALSLDINRDGVMDQICAIRKAGSANVFLVAGIQNPITGEYARLPEITTSITQARTLLLYSTDLLGDRSNPVIVSGMTSDNNHALAVFLPETERIGAPTLNTIADLRSDGPISIKDVERSDAYNLGVTSGESFAIHTYNSDPGSPDTLDQIERIYRWNRRSKHYEQVSESRIQGKRLESRLVSQLQGANLETFEDFLNGLWYLPASTGRQGARYLFFDTQKREITFHSKSVQEVFIRESGSPRRYGAYLTTRNKSIASIRRMIDIELTGIDEIKIKVLENVKLKIGVASDWDGTYRKMSATSFAPQEQESVTVSRIRTLLTEPDAPWVSSDGQELEFNAQTYSYKTINTVETGNYALMTIKDQTVLQLRSSTGDAHTTFFIASIETDTPDTGRKKLVLTEILVSMEGIRSSVADPVEFSPKP